MKMTVIAHAVIILLATGLSFATSLPNGFVNWDDALYVVDNPDIRSFDLKSIAGHFTTQHLGPYAPLTLVVHSAIYRVAGLNPVAYHLVAWLLHLTNALLAWRLAEKMTGNPSAALAVGLLFGVHPLRVESVAWVAEMKDVLCTMFFFGAMLSYWKYMESARRRFYAGTVLLFLLALLAKSMAVTLPLVLLLLDFVRDGRIGRAALARTVPLLVFSAAASVAACVAQKGVGALTDLSAMSIVPRLTLPLAVMAFHITKGLFPFNLSAFYPLTLGFTWAHFVIPFAVVAPGYFFFRMKDRILVMSFLFFVMTILPVAQIVPIGSALTSDRYFYIPGFGIALALGVLAQRFKLSRILLPAYIATLAIISFERCTVWRNEITLWEDTVRRAPDSAFVLNNLADAYLNRGRYLLAVETADKAIRSHPGMANPWFVRATAFREMTDYQNALADYNMALRLGQLDAKTLNGRGLTHILMGDAEAARADFREALRKDPGYRPAAANLRLLEPG